MSDDYSSQYLRVLRIFLNAREHWVPITRFLDAGITRFGARIWELRRAGHTIEMKEERRGRTRLVSYRLVPKGQQELFG